MTFEERKSEAQKLVAKFLDDFSPPRGVPDDRLLSRIQFIADSFARKMPTKGDYREAIEKVLLKLRDTHVSNTWPSQAAFVMAMPAGDRKEFAQLQQFKTDERERYSRLMTDGESVPETVIWGNIANGLSLPPGRLEAYRKASAASWQKTYKQDAYQLMRSKYGAQVDLYFHQSRSAAGEPQ